MWWWRMPWSLEALDKVIRFVGIEETTLLDVVQLKPHHHINLMTFQNLFHNQHATWSWWIWNFSAPEYLQILKLISFIYLLCKRNSSVMISKHQVVCLSDLFTIWHQKMRKYWIIRTSHVRQALTSVWRALIQMFISGLPQEFKTQRKPGFHGIYLFFLHWTSMIVQNYTYQKFTEIYNLISNI